MAFDEALAERVRGALVGVADVTERQMFGGLAFLIGGHMACGVLGDELMVRLGDQGADAALEERYTRPMDFTGRPLRSMVFVGNQGTERGGLDHWVKRAVSFAQALPPKAVGPA